MNPIDSSPERRQSREHVPAKSFLYDFKKALVSSNGDSWCILLERWSVTEIQTMELPEVIKNVFQGKQDVGQFMIRCEAHLGEIEAAIESARGLSPKRLFGLDSSQENDLLPLRTDNR